MPVEQQQIGKAIQVGVDELRAPTQHGKTGIAQLRRARLVSKRTIGLLPVEGVRLIEEIGDEQVVPAGTVVSFIGQTGSGGSAKIEADGAYRLVGPTGGETIPADKYKVVLMPVVDTSMTSDEAMKLKPEELPKADSTIPEKYQSQTTTPLEHEVKEGDNEINIDVAE